MTIKEHFRTNFNIRLQVVSEHTPIGKMLSGGILREFHSDRNIFKYNQIEIKADPFLFVHNDTLFLFYEEKRRLSKGYLMMTCTKDLKSFTVPRVILKEPFHLSFPFVFEDQGTVYLLPETGDAGEIRLYRFVDDGLSHVVFEKTLICGEFVDSSIVFKNNQYYLFTSDRQFNQRIFVSSALFGNYLEHTSSPIYTGKDYGRNAGSIIKYNDCFYRPSQDCSRLYGGNVSLHLLSELNQSAISESLYIKNLFDCGVPFYKYGGHQFNIAIFEGQIIIATDASDLNFNIFKLLQKILLKIFKKNV